MPQNYSDQLKWYFRAALMTLNRGLASVCGVKKAKVLLTKLYKKRLIDLDNPRKLNEKLLASYYQSDLKRLAELTDKYMVREFIQQKGLEDIIVPLYGVYDTFEQINFDKIPKQFVLKATHGCDMNLICTDKAELSLEAVKKKVNFWLHMNLAYMALELHYSYIQPRILCEKNLDTEGGIIDYKFHCHNGQVLFVLVCSERSDGNYRDVFMPDWTPRPEVVVNAKCNPSGIKKPASYERMLEIAKKLSEEFPFVRVDLYEVNGKIYFGELTFTPAAGILEHFSDEFLLEQGELWEWS